MIFCPYCGKELRADFAYCPYCGRKVHGGDEGLESSHGNDRLEVEFRALVKRLPSEALSHFKSVDKDIWQVVKSGAPNEHVLKQRGWIGPYAVKICGIVYHAYAKEDLLAASQVKFLSFWSGGAKKGIRRIRRQLERSKDDASQYLISNVTAFIVLFGILLGVILLALRWGCTF